MAHLEIIRSRQVTRWQRFTDALRSFTLGPFNLKDRTLVKYFGGAPVSAGVVVNEDTAFAVSAFYAAVVMVAWDLASLPLCLFRRLDGGGKTRYSTHALYRLLHDSPNPQQTSFEFRAGLMVNVLALGNGYAEIERDHGGRPVALWPLETHRVTQRLVNGALVYDHTQPSTGAPVTLPARDVLHIKGPSLDGLTGFDTIRIARQALGMAIAAEQFGATFFSNGAQLGGILHANGLNQQSRDNLKAALEARHQGVARAHRWLLAPEGSTFTEVGTSPKDSQLTELREHQVREIARFLRIPVVLIGDLSRATWGNYGEAKLQYFDSCIRPWCVNIEQHCTFKLVSSLERAQQFVEHVTEGFLRADTDKRATFYGQMLDRGVFTINEVRERENLPPLSGGDTARVPMNFEPLQGTKTNEDDEIEPAGRKAVVLAAHRGVLVDALRRVLVKLSNRAEKSRSDPRKLRHFCGVFFEDASQGEAARAVLLPAVTAWLAYTGSEADPSLATDLLVRKVFEESKEQLLTVAEIGSDSELYHSAISTLLQRWTDERPGLTADWVLTQGLTADGALATPAPQVSHRMDVSETRGMSLAWKARWQKTKQAMLAT